MLLKVGFKCPICSERVEWIYDAEKDQTHISAMGCPGGCTAIHETEIRKISKEEAQKHIDDQQYQINNLDLVTDDS